MIIDANANLGPCLYPDRWFEHPPTLDALVVQMEAAGVDRAVVAPLKPPSFDVDDANRRLAQTIENRDVFIGIARIDPRVDACAEHARRAIEKYGLCGLKLHPGEDSFPIDDPMVEAVLQVAAGHRRPVWIHAGYPGVSEALSVRDVALAHPDVPIVVVHSAQRNVSGLGVRETLTLAEATANTYFETSGVYRQDLLRDLVELVGPERVVFGSNAPYYDLRLEIMRITRSGLDRSHQATALTSIGRLLDLD